MAGAVEEEAGRMQVVRLTVELLRPVPLSPLRLTTARPRPGRNVSLVEATLLADQTEVARARALAIRRERLEVPVDRSGPPVPPPEDGEEWPPPGQRRTAFADAVDLMFVKGGWEETGPVTMWTRLRVPVVDDRPPSALQRTAAAADFGNGVSRVLEFETHTFINPDLTVSLARVPQGEWILFDSVTRLSDEGYGQAESQIFDRVGPVGRSVQSLIVSRR
jgi:hypothetical protein